MTRPVIGIACSSHKVEDAYEVQMTGRRTIDGVRDVCDCLPLLIPGLPDAIDIPDLCATLDGVILTGSRANVHPKFYGEELGPEHGAMDVDRDDVMLPLVRAASAVLPSSESISTAVGSVKSVLTSARFLPSSENVCSFILTRSTTPRNGSAT